VHQVSSNLETVDERVQRVVSQDRPPSRRRGRWRPRRAVRIALWSLLAVLVLTVAVGGWALNRYVIDHVEIGDVRTYEQQVKVDTTEPPLATFSVPDTAN
jgi:hypothetical protein